MPINPVRAALPRIRAKGKSEEAAVSMLGVIVRSRPASVAALGEQLRGLPGVDVAHDVGDGRLLLVIEDAGGLPAATRLTEIATWPAVINTSLVYEYSGADLNDAPVTLDDYAAWRGSTRAAAAAGPA